MALHNYYVYFNDGTFQAVPQSKPPVLVGVSVAMGTYRDLNGAGTQTNIPTSSSSSGNESDSGTKAVNSSTPSSVAIGTGDGATNTLQHQTNNTSDVSNTSKVSSSASEGSGGILNNQGVAVAGTGHDVLTTLSADGSNVVKATAPNVYSFPDDITHIPPRPKTETWSHWEFRDDNDDLLASPRYEDVLNFSTLPPQVLIA